MPPFNAASATCWARWGGWSRRWRASARRWAAKPGWAEAHCALGATLRDLGQLDEAVACQRQAIALKPDHVPAHNNLGTALRELGRPDEAVAACRVAVALGAAFPQPHINLGNALRDQGALEEAIGCYRTALRIEPDNADTHNNLAMALLAGGRMAEGWVEHEWRWQTAQMAASRRSFAQPQWRGEPASGRTLLIHAEQGFGDTLQFCRYATLAAERGLRVILEVPKPLVRLLRSLHGVAGVVASGDPLPAFDLQCPMMSLPLALGTTETTIPHAASYLRADAAQIAGWSARLAAEDGLRVGLLWAGNARSHSPHMVALDHRRSLAPERLAPLLGIPGVRYFSLQKDPPHAPDAFQLEPTIWAR